MIIHILDDEETILDAMSFLLAPLELKIHTWENSVVFLEEADLYQHGMVLLDMRMPYLDGSQVHQKLRELQSTLSVVIMTAHGDVPMAVAELKNGAIDFLEKPVTFDKLKQVIKQADLASQQAVRIHQILQNYKCLTEKEKAVVPHIMQGLTNKQIADKLAVSIRTVEVHRAAVMGKMQAESLAGLVQKISELQNRV
ncbi:response regulator [Mannheimia sp. AT1]|uniref:Response regulator n=1 Tax=Mannheimia cairinae TaxID=3025936 RepID=A0ABT5MUC4_9PAST|nr:response regulator [Mannheimia cairinae]MDD0824468.1 response regulator [Mannheimia cairinae]MDD0825569.1 response regulator [Mannheimia cairinae]